MGKFYDLVEFRNYLVDNSEKLCLNSSIQDKIDILEKTKKVFPKQSEYIDKNINDYITLDQQSKIIISNLNSKISLLNQEIDDTANSLFTGEEYADYFHEKNIAVSHFQKELIISIETFSHIESKITGYSTWQYPSLQINPRSKKWIDPMVAGDPLYLTHIDINILKTLINSYPELYQNRLRLYEIMNRDFSNLPQGQFRFVLCWDNFNYLSSDKIEKYLREVWNLLRPGGCFMFSYNNCDLLGPALRAECRAGSYTSSRWLTALSEIIGYEIISLKDIETGDAFNTHVSWAEIKKPGILKSAKASQAMAQILRK